MKKKSEAFTRYTALVVIMALIITTISGRLLYLQVVKAEEFKEKANNSSMREIPDPAPRGNILDKNGVALAVNNQSYTLVYNETTESKKTFFETMDKVFTMLEENGETFRDDFELKLNPFRFEFKTDDPEIKKQLELRFKKDRGFDDDIRKKLYNKDAKKLTKEEKNKVEQEVLKISPEDTFKMLLGKYEIQSNYTAEKQRKFMIIRDTLKMQSFLGYKPVVIALNIKQDTSYLFLQRMNDLPGIDVNTQPIRYYPFNELGSAFLGYISKISTNTEKYEELGYNISTDYVGKEGIEGAFEDRLRGTNGGRIVKLNKNGRITEELGKREPYPGQTIKLTIDKNVQEAAEKQLDETMSYLRAHPSESADTNTVNATRGAAVAIDLTNGGILALASRPGFDPNIFATPGKLTPELYKKFFSPDLGEFGKQYVTEKGLAPIYGGVEEAVNAMFPLKQDTNVREDKYDVYPKSFYNYATMSMLPPGSTFKPMTAIAGLEEGVIDPNTTIYDNLVYTKNNFNGGELNTSSYGEVNVVKALEVSNNYFFYEVGDRLYNKGFDTLAKHSWKFGLGVDPKGKAKPATGIEIAENFGKVANVESIGNLFSTMSIIELNSKLTKDYGINLTVNDSDNEEIKKMKENIKDSIKQQMKYKNNSSFTAQLKDMFRQFIDKSPELKGKNISDNDVKSIVQQINITINQVNSQVTTPGNIYNAAIGQGINQFTPLQLANYVATIVNGGNRYKLHLVDKFLDAKGNVIGETKPEIVEKINLKPATIEAVKQGMAKVNSGTEGTAAYTFAGFPIPTAGKTGSATFNEHQSNFGRTSAAVYIGFAPYDNPKVAVCIIILDGGHGGAASPVARAMYEAYFKDELTKMNYTPQYYKYNKD